MSLEIDEFHDRFSRAVKITEQCQNEADVVNKMETCMTVNELWKLKCDELRQILRRHGKSVPGNVRGGRSR